MTNERSECEKRRGRVSSMGSELSSRSEKSARVKMALKSPFLKFWLFSAIFTLADFHPSNFVHFPYYLSRPPMTHLIVSSLGIQRNCYNMIKIENNVKNIFFLRMGTNCGHMVTKRYAYCNVQHPRRCAPDFSRCRRL